MEEVIKLSSRFQNDELIVITLEDTNKSFSVSKALLYGVSDYFIAALESSFMEGEERTLRLAGCTTETFEVVLYWICVHRLPHNLAVGTGDDNPDDLSEERRMQIAHIQQTLIRVWCFADEHLMPSLQNQTMWMLLRGLRHSRLTAPAACLAFELNCPESCLCRAIIRELAHDYRTKSYTDEQKMYLAASPRIMVEMTELILDKGWNGTSASGLGVAIADQAESYGQYMVAER